jgi:hypothetical protein
MQGEVKDVNTSVHDLLRLALALSVLLVLLPSCTSIGAGSVHRRRLDYSEALTTSWKDIFTFLLLLTSLARPAWCRRSR